MISNLSFSIIFLITGTPTPAMLDMAFSAQKAGLETLLIVLDRGEEGLKIDKALVNYEIITINVPYKAVDYKRVTSMPNTYKEIKRIIINRLKPNGIIFTSSYDLLFLSNLIAIRKKYRLRHQVRDLHILQLSKTFKSYLYRKLENILLKRVDRLIVSSPEFIDKYYRKIYYGKTVFLENTPLKSTWINFKRCNSPRPFTIGYIGIIRYKKSLYQLIDAVEFLFTQGIHTKVLFAGGGDVSDLKKRIKYTNLFEFYGAYEYSCDIKNLYSKIDLIYAVYDSYNLNCQLAMPNKFYESIISKIPIVVAKNTFVAKEVLRLQIGTDIVSGDIEGLTERLRIGVLNEGWYANSLQQLAVIDENTYFEDYDKALAESILF